MTPAVVVIAYQRPQALQRLLRSLLRARYTEGEDVRLVISIDRGQGPGWTSVVQRARDFYWPFGTKEVVEHTEHLGLVRHFRESGRLTQRLGDLVMLEDDLTVSPAYLDFASATLDCYRSDARVAGVCLYGLWFNGFTREPFLPLDDGSDVFFLNLPHTQGLAFTPEQWSRFESWSGGAPRLHPQLHPAFLRFGAAEWFPQLAYYMAAERRFFCFPRVSLTVGWGDQGTHFGDSTGWFQTALQAGRRAYQLLPLDDSLAVYDGFYELLPEKLRLLAPDLPPVPFDVDINGTKQRANLHHDYVLTTRPVGESLASFGLQMYPPEANVGHAVSGSELSLARIRDVRWDPLAALESRRRLHFYLWRRLRPSRRRDLGFEVARLAEAYRARHRRPKA